ncbi:MAG: DUF1311 domain-containing protein [Pseudorhodobacter sp.]|nr:MAG: DUF1311 domain-containing protein [Pseudorhodobacter sp.]
MAVMQAIDADLPEDERGAADLLRKGQKAWISFRDDACAAEGYVMHGGSAEPMLVYGCMARLTEARAEDLRLIANTGYRTPAFPERFAFTFNRISNQFRSKSDTCSITNNAKRFSGSALPVSC